MVSYFISNGDLVPGDLFRAEGLKYGDGLFETIRIAPDCSFLHAHFERLKQGAEFLHLDLTLNFQDLHRIVGELKTNHKNASVLRIALFRSSNIFQESSSASIISLQVYSAAKVQTKALNLGIYPEPCKLAGWQLNRFKHANYLPSILAKKYAVEHGFDDALMLNQYGRIVEATTSNLFLFYHGKWITPALAEGCVAGIYRKFLLDNFSMAEAVVTFDMLEAAEELFLTNAVQGIMPVSMLQHKKLNYTQTENLMAAHILRRNK